MRDSSIYYTEMFKTNSAETLQWFDVYFFRILAITQIQKVR